MPSLAVRPATLLCALLGLTLPERASAQSADARSADARKTMEADPRAAARRLGTEGLQAYDAAFYEVAVARLGEAIALHDAPTLRLYRARSLGHLGRWIEALRDYDVILRAPADESETRVTADARENASRESSEAYRKLARLRFEYAGITPRGVRIDGQPLTPAELRGSRDLDPGKHFLELERPQSEPLRIELKAGESEDLLFSLDSLQLKRQRRELVPPRPRTALRLEPVPRAAPHPAASRDAGAPSKPDDDEDVRDTFHLSLSFLGYASRSVDFAGDADDYAVSSSLVFSSGIQLFPFSGALHHWLGFSAESLSMVGDGRNGLEAFWGLRSRWVWPTLTLGFKLLYGNQSSLQVESAGPSLQSKFILPGGSLTWQAGALSLTGELGVALPLDQSSDGDIYPEFSSYFFEGRLSAEYRLWRWLGAELSLRRRQAEVKLGAPRPDPTLVPGYVGGNASDVIVIAAFALTGAW